MSLQKLLQNNKKNIQDIENFVDESFQNIKEMNLKSKIVHPKLHEVCEIQIISKKFPLDLKLQENIKEFLVSGVLKPFDNKKHKYIFEELLSRKKMHKLIEMLINLFVYFQ